MPTHETIGFLKSLILAILLLNPYKMRHSLIAIVLMLFTFFEVHAQQGHVLIIGIDGCRPDAIIAANAPSLDGLISSGTWSPHALNIPPTWSGTGWSSMLTGVWPVKHGVTDNSFSTPNFVAYPHFFNHVENNIPSLQTESLVHWGPINTEIVDLVDYEQTYSTDAAVKTAAVDRLTNHDPDVLFLHFDDVDHAGHSYGFDPSIPNYISSIEATDAHIGDVLTALYARPNYAAENWLVMVSTDHGGNLSGHGGSSLEEQNIFLIVSGGSAPVEEITRQEVSTTWNNSHNFTTSTHAKCADPALGDFGNADFSIECWVKTNGWFGDPAIISNKDWDAGANAGFVLFGTTNGSSWKVNIGDGSDRIDIDGGVINDGLWHHLAITCDRDGYASVFQDGRLMGQSSMTSIGNLNAGLDLCLGQDGTESYPFQWTGGIAEVRLWDNALTAEAIENNFCAELDGAHPDIASLRAYWPVHDGSGTVITATAAADMNLQGPPNWSLAAQQFDCLDYSGTPRIVDLVPTALKHLGIVISPTWSIDGDCFGILPPACSIDGYSLGIQTGCAALTGDYLQEVEIDYFNPENHSQLSINGNVFNLASEGPNFLLNGLLADGNPVDLVVSFVEDPTCSSTFSSAFVAPQSCSGGNDCIHDLNGDQIINTGDLLSLLLYLGTICE